MYGTVAKMRVKPGGEAALAAYSQEVETGSMPGHIATYIYRTDANSDEHIMATIFESKDAYVANANSADQNTRYEKLLALLAGPPEWNDGEIVYSQVQDR